MLQARDNIGSRRSRPTRPSLVQRRDQATLDRVEVEGTCSYSTKASRVGVVGQVADARACVWVSVTRTGAWREAPSRLTRTASHRATPADRRRSSAVNPNHPFRHHERTSGPGPVWSNQVWRRPPGVELNDIAERGYWLDDGVMADASASRNCSTRETLR